MSFAYPAGLLGLLCIPVLILLYLLRPKFERVPVSSHYLWQLSMRFQRKKLLDSRFKRLLLLAVQLLAVAAVSLLLAQPRLRVDGLANDEIAILDTSGSMQIADETGVSAFDRAKEAILSRAEREHFWSTTTVLTTDGECLVERSQSYSEIGRAVQSAACGWGAGNLQGAMAAAQELLRACPDARVRLYTDRTYARTQNVEVVDVSGEGAWNAAVSALRAEATASGMRFIHRVDCTRSEPELTLALYVDGALQSAQIVSCEAGVPLDVSWYVPDLYAYDHVRVMADVQDGLSRDDECVLFGEEEIRAKALLISETPYYLERALDALGTLNVTTALPRKAPELFGYDLYVLDGWLPPALPADGACWLMNPPAGEVACGLVLGEETGGKRLQKVEKPEDKRLSMLTENLTLRDAALMKLRVAEETGSMTAVVNSGKDPAVLAGTTPAGAPCVSMLFDLHASNLPMLADYMVLMHNMVSYSMPPMLDALSFEVGAPIEIHVLPFCRRILLGGEDGKTVELPLEGSDARAEMRTPGLYTLTQERSVGGARSVRFAVAMPRGESLRTSADEALTLLRPAQSEPAEPRGVQLYPYLAAALLVLLIVEGVVDRRESV